MGGVEPGVGVACDRGIMEKGWSLRTKEEPWWVEPEGWAWPVDMGRILRKGRGLRKKDCFGGGGA